MQFRKNGETTVMEAVDNLSHMAEVDLYATKVATGLTDEQMGEQMDTLSWYDPTYQAYNQDRIKETFRILHKYMQELYDKDKGQLRDLETQQGIQALMLLAGEAAQKIDNFTEIFKGESVTELKEFKELQHFYLTKVVQRFQALTEPQEEWHAEWGAGIEEAEGLKDLNAVRRDKYYEFFLIRREDGRPLFTRNVLRHMQLVGQFDALTVDQTVETPFTRIEMIQDRDMHMSAKEILQLAAPYIDDFYKDALKHKGKDFVSAVHKSLMALMLAANSRNLMQNTTNKTSLEYYTDFHNYLRKALSSKEYRNYIASPPSSDERFLNALMNLSHILSASFFLRIGSRKDMVAFIRMLIEKGTKGSVNQAQTSSPLMLWNNLID
ncbi:MAG: hypothetical protein HYX67_14685, partial [Candidatus Melainabacteria bacterium]|nr:hypothetical protein [Candidatus Melainabacteria bacterium]